MKRLLTVIILAVAEVAVSAQRPDSLPIGTREKVKTFIVSEINDIMINIGMVTSEQPRKYDLLWLQEMGRWKYDESIGDLEVFIAEKTKRLLDSYVLEGDICGNQLDESKRYFSYVVAKARYRGDIKTLTTGTIMVRPDPRLLLHQGSGRKVLVSSGGLRSQAGLLRRSLCGDSSGGGALGRYAITSLMATLAPL